MGVWALQVWAQWPSGAVSSSDGFHRKAPRRDELGSQVESSPRLLPLWAIWAMKAPHRVTLRPLSLEQPAVWDPSWAFRTFVGSGKGMRYPLLKSIGLNFSGTWSSAKPVPRKVQGSRFLTNGGSTEGCMTGRFRKRAMCDWSLGRYIRSQTSLPTACLEDPLPAWPCHSPSPSSLLRRGMALRVRPLEWGAPRQLAHLLRWQVLAVPSLLFPDYVFRVPMFCRKIQIATLPVRAKPSGGSSERSARSAAL